MRKAFAASGVALAVAVTTFAGAAPAQTAPAAPATEAELVGLDAEALKAERALNEAVAAATGRPVQEIAPRAAALGALERNLDIRRAQLQPELAARALQEAEALFDPVFGINLFASATDYDKRVERTRRWKKATVAVPATNVGRTNLDWTGIDCIPVAGNTECYRIYNPANSPVLFQEFDAPRAAGFGPATVEAQPLLPTDERYTLNATVSQLLPWGTQLLLSGSLSHIDHPFTLNANDPNRTTFGRYERPWARDLAVSMTTPLPLTRRWGVGNDARLSAELVAKDVESSRWLMRALINQALLEADQTYWDLVGAVLRLQAASESVAQGEDLLARTKRRYDARQITEAAMGEVEARFAQLQARREAAMADVVTASNNLRRVTNAPGEGLLLPIGYRDAMARDLAELPGVDAVIDNPLYSAATVELERAGTLLEARERQDNPDVGLTVSSSLTQSSALFGYEDPDDALFANPDRWQARATLTWLQPIPDRTVRANLEIAQLGQERQRLELEQVRLDLRGAYVNARSALDTAGERVAITRRAAELAEEVYAQAQRGFELGRVPQYELTRQLLSVLDARRDAALAQVARKQAQARLLATLGALPARYADQTSQNDWDRARLQTLAEGGHLQHFGEPR